MALYKTRKALAEKNEPLQNPYAAPHTMRPAGPETPIQASRTMEVIVLKITVMLTLTSRRRMSESRRYERGSGVHSELVCNDPRDNPAKQGSGAHDGYYVVRDVVRVPLVYREGLGVEKRIVYYIVSCISIAASYSFRLSLQPSPVAIAPTTNRVYVLSLNPSKSMTVLRPPNCRLGRRDLTRSTIGINAARQMKPMIRTAYTSRRHRQNIGEG